MNAETSIFLKFMADKPNSEYGSANIHKKIALEEIAFIQVNGKSNYKFNSEKEMRLKFHELLIKLLQERTDELLGESNDRNIK